MRGGTDEVSEDNRTTSEGTGGQTNQRTDEEKERTNEQTDSQQKIGS